MPDAEKDPRDADGRVVPSAAAQAAHKAFHEAWGGPAQPLDLYAFSPIWEAVADAVRSVLPPAEKDPATLTDKEIELREWLRAQPGGAQRWVVIKAGFRRSYDMGVNHGWGLGAKHMRAVLTRVLPPAGGRA